MVVSRKNGTVPEDWVVPLPALYSGRDGESRVTIRGYRISWHPVIYFVGGSTLVRAAVNVPGAVNDMAGLGVIYGICGLMAWYVGRQFRIRGDERSPFYSAQLGMAGLAISTVKPMVIKHDAPLTVPSVTVPLVVLSILIAMVYGTGQLTKHFPAQRFTGAKATPARTTKTKTTTTSTAKASAGTPIKTTAAGRR